MSKVDYVIVIVFMILCIVIDVISITVVKIIREARKKIRFNEDREILKLFRIDYMDDCEYESCLMVAENEDDVKKKFEEEVFSKLSCPMCYSVFEIKEVDGHKILVK